MTSYAHVGLVSVKCYVAGYKNKLEKKEKKIPDDVPHHYENEISITADGF